MNTQINIQIPVPGNRESSLDEVKQSLYDEDIDFNLIAVDQDGDSKMELVYLNENLLDVPMLNIMLSTYILEKTGSKLKVQEYFSKLGYAVSGIGLTMPNKQYFTTSHSDTLCTVEFLNGGSHTQEEIISITEKIKILADNIYNNPQDFNSNYYEDLAKEDEHLDMQWKNEETDTYYQMTYKKEPVTEWRKQNKDEDWTEFIKELHTEYKNNINV